MKVKVAKTAGFCFGVKRAVDKVYQLIEAGSTADLYTRSDHPQRRSGILILQTRGVQVIEEQDLDISFRGNCCDPFPWCGQRQSIRNLKEIIWTMLMLPVLSYSRYTAL